MAKRKGQREEERRRRWLSTCSGGAAGGEGEPGSGGRDWSGLPGPALLSILEYIAHGCRLADLRAFSGVCRAWRLASDPRTREPYLPPLLMAYTAAHRAEGDAFLGLYSLPDGRFYRRKDMQMPPVLLCERIWIVGFSCGYLVVTGPGNNWVRCYHRLFLVDPLADGAEASAHIELPTAPLPITSALLTASPTSGEDCVVVALDSTSIQCCRLGDAAWRVFEFPLEHASVWMYHLPDHAVSLGDKVYVLLQTGDVLVFALFPNLSMTLLEVKGLGHLKFRAFASSFLTELNGEILVLFKEEQVLQCAGRLATTEDWCCKDHEDTRKGQRYVLYKLDLSTREWVRLDSLGDYALFLNYIGRSILCDATKWGGSRNCVYRLCPTSGKMSIFHMESGIVEHHPFPLEHHPATSRIVKSLYSFCWILPTPRCWL